MKFWYIYGSKYSTKQIPQNIFMEHDLKILMIFGINKNV